MGSFPGSVLSCLFVCEPPMLDKRRVVDTFILLAAPPSVAEREGQPLRWSGLLINRKHSVVRRTLLQSWRSRHIPYVYVQRQYRRRDLQSIFPILFLLQKFICYEKRKKKIWSELLWPSWNFWTSFKVSFNTSVLSNGQKQNERWPRSGDTSNQQAA